MSSGGSLLVSPVPAQSALREWMSLRVPSRTSITKQSFLFVVGSLGVLRRSVNNGRFDLCWGESPMLEVCHE
ncbi:hypothetical protein HMPREF9057_00589 [Actinomyces sp. oral taxon 171 str. F0337]|nr:hypothetical protein HMPREF9057_00589 [Actinomyces sp. oral taxon 171 str. F0337]